MNDSSARFWERTAAGFGAAFVAFVAGAVAVSGAPWVALLSALATLAAVAVIASWIGNVRNWDYPLLKKPPPLSAETREILAQLSRQSLFQRPRHSESLRRARRF